jgi:EAL domain-containing protein (putative c-di-GMP-specific phosphodiesterase class I)
MGVNAMPVAGHGSTVHRAATIPAGVDSVLDGRQVRTLFQPLVHLVDGEVVGFEALSRGPEGGVFEDPVMLFAAAGKAGRLSELDWLCVASASRAAHRARLHPSMTIFVNFKPETLAQPYPRDVAEDIGRARQQLRFVAEIDESDLRNDPAQVLSAAAHARADGWGVALDNVGATPGSLALLPVLRPDVVKLDLRVLSENRGSDSAEVETAVRAYAETSGAVVLAHRVESTEDVLSARAFGATYGQGWRYGHPGTLPAENHTPRAPFPLIQSSGHEGGSTPFDVVRRHRESIPTEKRMLKRISTVLEHRALSNGASTVLLATFQDRRHLTDETASRYQRLAQRASLTVIFGAQMAGITLPDVNVVGLAPREALCREWNVIVVGPHYTGALVARDRGEGGEEQYRRFDHIVTHDRDLVVEAARSLLGWIAT